MGTFKAAEALIEPIMRLHPLHARLGVHPAPFILWLGIGDVEKVVIFVGSFFQPVPMVAVVAKNACAQDMLETANPGRQAQAKIEVLLPASLPGILDTLRIIVGWAPWTYRRGGNWWPLPPASAT